jgi:hypothetical protein
LDVNWEALKVAGQEPLAERATKRLRSEELMIAKLGPSVLQDLMNKIPLWRNEKDVSVAQLASDFAQYLYLPRLDGPHVLIDSIEAGCGLATWERDSWAYADAWDETEKRYRGLRAGQHVTIPDVHSAGLLVRPDVAKAQLASDLAQGPKPQSGANPVPGEGPTPTEPGEPAATRLPTSYHGSVELDPSRVGRDAGRIAEEVISHLAGLVGSDVTVTLEIQARVPKGVSDAVVRTVTENGRTLKFTSQGFEEE